MADNPLLAALTQKQSLPAGDVSQALAGGQGRLPMQFGLGQQGMGGAPGPGTGGRQVAMGAPALGGGVQSPAVAAQAAFNAKWGQVPAQQALAQRNAGSFGVGGTEQTAGAAGGPTTGQPKASGPAPAQASQMNAASPGILNGNPENGIPKAEAGVGTPPTAAATQTARRGREAMAPGAGNDLMAALSAPAPETRAASGTNGYTPEDLWEGQDPNAGVQVREPTDATNATTAPATTTPAPTAQANTATKTTPGIWSLGGIQYQTKGPLPAQWQTMTKAQRSQWLQNPEHASPVSQSQYDSTKLLNEFPALSALKLPSAVPAGGGGALFPSMSRDDINKLSGGDQSLATLIGNWQNQWISAQQAEQMYGPTAPEVAEAIRKANVIEQVLGNYGYDFSEDAPGAGTGTGTGGNVGGPPGGIGGLPANPGTWTDISNSDPTAANSGFMQLLNGFLRRGYEPGAARAMAEAAMAAAKDKDLQNNTQAAVDLWSQQTQAFENSPLYTGVQSLSQEILNNPDPVDWTGNKNRLASDYAKSREQTSSALSEALAGRGLSASTGAGLQVMANSQNQMDLSRALGEMSTQEQMQKRAAQDSAIRTALTGMGGTQGVSLSNYQNLASLIKGDPMQYGNAYSGIAGALTNADAQKLAEKAQDQASSFTWEDAANLYAQIISGASQASAGA